MNKPNVENAKKTNARYIGIGWLTQSQHYNSIPNHWKKKTGSCIFDCKIEKCSKKKLRKYHQKKKI
jgi:hypothetical protein